MRHHLLATIPAAVAVVLTTLLTVAAFGASSAPRAAAVGPIELTGADGPEVRQLTATVVDAARAQGVPIAANELEVVFVDRVAADGYLGGWTDGRLVLVGRNVALPERTLLHEVAHAVVGVEVGHDEPWRSVYISAFRDVFGGRAAERELRRIRWVYDGEHGDSESPTHGPNAGTRRHHEGRGSSTSGSSDRRRERAGSRGTAPRTRRSRRRGGEDQGRSQRTGEALGPTQQLGSRSHQGGPVLARRGGRSGPTELC
jgi:hypothetical protein